MRKYAGDTLWALAAFFSLKAVLPRMHAVTAAGIAIGAASTVEISQLYQAPFINAIRDTRVGGLILGFGFKWSDLVCYTCGAGVGMVLDLLLTRSKSSEEGEQKAERAEQAVEGQ
ncbi:DUF2809 domain-containing protein [Verrucomicrobiota bacterium]